MACVFVAMSGGVDSSVAAALLLEQGHDVTGITMELQPASPDADGCCAVAATRDARRVCDLLGIPHVTVDFRDLFQREVVVPFASEYAAGRTPNPCVVCNDRVKFSGLLAEATTRGGRYLATGHYARIVRDAGGTPWLARGLDAGKDQSYFLYRLITQQLGQLLFPVGELHKLEVRAMAERFGLPVAEKPDSQEICFADETGHVRTVAERAPDAQRPGKIVDLSGEVVGAHRGLVHHTVGQRKGLGIGGLREPLYVVALDAESNRVVVGGREALRVQAIEARDVRWRTEATESSAGEWRVLAAVRFRMEPQPATARVDGDTLTVTFDEPLFGVAPGQSVVCYEEDRVLGGGVISCGH